MLSRRSIRQAGYTLVEVIVAISIFLMFLSMFIAGVVKLTRTTYAAAERSESSSSLSVLYQAIDPKVRYAQYINEPQKLGSHVYVEMFVPSTSTSDTLNHCTQLRYDSTAGTVAMRNWSWVPTDSADVHRGPNSSGLSTNENWQVKAAGVLAAPVGSVATYPFERILPGDGVLYQRLKLNVRIGSEGYRAETGAETIYLARNSETSPTATGLVCDGTGYRP
ncbi:MAG: PulJ/GspJ family protein [Pseudoclavibacter sp.]